MQARSYVFEIAILLSLVMTIAVTVPLLLRDRQDRAGVDVATAPLTETLEARCRMLSRASDRVVAAQTRGNNCFQLLTGNDRIELAQGPVLVFPGPGNDTVSTQTNIGRIEIHYESGRDTYTLKSSETVIDLSQYTRDQVSFTPRLSTARTHIGDESFDPSNRETADLFIAVPTGAITVAGHFTSYPLQGVRLKDGFLSGYRLSSSAVSQQGDDRSNTILGTADNDLLHPLGGNDVIRAGRGDDIVFYTEGDDSFEPGPGFDTLEMTDFGLADISLTTRNNGRDLRIDTNRGGSVVVKGQFSDEEAFNDSAISALVIDGSVLSWLEIKRRTILNQVSDTDDVIQGTNLDDVISSKAGNDVINPYGGDDIIVHTAGADTVTLPERRNGYNILDLRGVVFQDIELRTSGVADLVLATPNGSVTVTDQLVVSADPRIDLFRFADQDLKHEQILLTLGQQEAERAPTSE